MSTTVEAPSYRIETFTQVDLLKQSFLHELRDVINASYYDTGASSYTKNGPRLKSDTQLADELQETGFTAIAFAQNSIIGTASLKISLLDPEEAPWKLPGYFEHFSADQILSGSSAVHSSGEEYRNAPWSGGFELVAVAIKPDPLYRRKGIAKCLVRACEEELKKRMTLVGDTGLSRSCITLRCIREIQGAYWLKRGFRVVGEQYYPPFTWDYSRGFVLWAMERRLSV